MVVDGRQPRGQMLSTRLHPVSRNWENGRQDALRIFTNVRVRPFISSMLSIVWSVVKKSETTPYHLQAVTLSLLFLIGLKMRWISESTSSLIGQNELAIFDFYIQENQDSQSMRIYPMWCQSIMTNNGINADVILNILCRNNCHKRNYLDNRWKSCFIALSCL